MNVISLFGERLITPSLSLNSFISPCMTAKAATVQCKAFLIREDVIKRKAFVSIASELNLSIIYYSITHFISIVNNGIFHKKCEIIGTNCLHSLIFFENKGHIIVFCFCQLKLFVLAKSMLPYIKIHSVIDESVKSRE